MDLSDKMLAIFPQEATYYQGMGADINWVGHPLVDHVHQFPPREQARQQLGLHPQQPMMALMPASRQQELDHLLPIILTAARRIYHQVPNLQFWMPLALSAYRRDVTQAIQKTGLPISISPDSQTVIAAADVVITKSGTANLEAALLNVPQVVVYRVGAISAWLYQHLLHFEVEFISPVNLVVGREIVPELLQQEVTPEKIAELACSLLEKGEARHTMMAEYQELRSHLGLPGVLQRAAEAILNALEQSLR